MHAAQKIAGNAQLCMTPIGHVSCSVATSTEMTICVGSQTLIRVRSQTLIHVGLGFDATSLDVNYPTLICVRCAFDANLVPFASYGRHTQRK